MLYFYTDFLLFKTKYIELKKKAGNNYDKGE